MTTDEFLRLVLKLRRAESYDYSGYWDREAKYCIAISFKSTESIFSFAVALGRLTKEEIPEPLINSAGIDIILYWPGFLWEEED